jgi:hypothetical protein
MSQRLSVGETALCGSTTTDSLTGHATQSESGEPEAGTGGLYLLGNRLPQGDPLPDGQSRS